jgi:hypothetical protein
VISIVENKKRYRALVKTNTERILFETGELSSRDVIYKLEREYSLMLMPQTLHQILRCHPRIKRIKTQTGTNYRLVET